MLSALWSFLTLFLETTFIMLFFGILHSQRRKLGNAAFYLVFCGVFFFALLAMAADTRWSYSIWLEFQVGATFLFMPCLALVLMLYVTEGTLPLQRLIIGEFALFAVLLYMVQVAMVQSFQVHLSWLPILAGGGFSILIRRIMWLLLAMAMAQLLDLFILPVVFSLMRRAGGRLFFSVLTALIFSTLSNTLIYFSVMGVFCKFNADVMLGTALMRFVLALYAALLLYWYFRRIEGEAAVRQRGVLDIVFAFIGSYGRSLQLERHVREWEERYRLLVERAAEMIILLDADGNIVEINRAGEKFIGRSAGELVKKSIGDYLVPERSTAGTAGGSVLPDEISSGDVPPGGMAQIFSRAKVTAVDPQGTAHHAFCTVSRLVMGGSLYAVLVGHDVTAEETLAAEKEQLRAQVEHMQRLESLGMLAGGVAHDFNNHLQAIIGHLDMLSYSKAMEDDSVRQRVEKLIGIAEQSGKLTSQLLGFARRGKYTPVRLDAETLLRQTLDLFHPGNINELNISFHAPENGEKLFITGDRVQLQQLVLNLLINAADAMKNSAEKSLKLILRRHNDYVCIAVSDSGCGMDKETQSRIFDPFFTTKPVGEGSGMGLAMVYGTVSHHGGSVDVHSEPGRGTVFEVFLPLAPEK